MSVGDGSARDGHAVKLTAGNLTFKLSGQAVVLDADDARCVAMAQRRRNGGEPIFFSLDGANPVLTRHLEGGGRGVYLRGGIIVLGHGHHGTPLVEAARLPLGPSHRALAAVGALLGLGVLPEHAPSLSSCPCP